jgi:hypothetical protein
MYPFQETMLLLTNEIKAKLSSMPFPYLVTLLILLPFVVFRKHSGLVRHNLCGARRRVKWRVRKCAVRWAFLHRKSCLQRSLIPTFFVRGGHLPLAIPPARAFGPRFGLRSQWIRLRLIFRDIGRSPVWCSMKMNFNKLVLKSHPGLPGVLYHSVKLWTSTPGYIAERACREELLDLAGTMTSPTW